MCSPLGSRTNVLTSGCTNENAADNAIKTIRAISCEVLQFRGSGGGTPGLETFCSACYRMKLNKRT